MDDDPIDEFATYRQDDFSNHVNSNFSVFDGEEREERGEIEEEHGHTPEHLSGLLTTLSLQSSIDNSVDNMDKVLMGSDGPFRLDDDVNGQGLLQGSDRFPYTKYDAHPVEAKSSRVPIIPAVGNIPDENLPDIRRRPIQNIPPTQDEMPDLGNMDDDDDEILEEGGREGAVHDSPLPSHSHLPSPSHSHSPSSRMPSPMGQITPGETIDSSGILNEINVSYKPFKDLEYNSPAYNNLKTVLSQKSSKEIRILMIRTTERCKLSFENALIYAAQNKTLAVFKDIFNLLYDKFVQAANQSNVPERKDGFYQFFRCMVMQVTREKQTCIACGLLHHGTKIVKFIQKKIVAQETSRGMSKGGGSYRRKLFLGSNRRQSLLVSACQLNPQDANQQIKQIETIETLYKDLHDTKNLEQIIKHSGDKVDVVTRQYNYDMAECIQSVFFPFSYGLNTDRYNQPSTHHPKLHVWETICQLANTVSYEDNIHIDYTKNNAATNTFNLVDWSDLLLPDLREYLNLSPNLPYALTGKRLSRKAEIDHHNLFAYLRIQIERQYETMAPVHRRILLTNDMLINLIQFEMWKYEEDEDEDKDKEEDKKKVKEIILRYPECAIARFFGDVSIYDQIVRKMKMNTTGFGLMMMVLDEYKANNNPPIFTTLYHTFPESMNYHIDRFKRMVETLKRDGRVDPRTVDRFIQHQIFDPASGIIDHNAVAVILRQGHKRISAETKFEDDDKVTSILSNLLLILLRYMDLSTLESLFTTLQSIHYRLDGYDSYGSAKLMEPRPWHLAYLWIYQDETLDCLRDMEHQKTRQTVTIKRLLTCAKGDRIWPENTDNGDDGDDGNDDSDDDEEIQRKTRQRKERQQQEKREQKRQREQQDAVDDAVDDSVDDDVDDDVINKVVENKLVAQLSDKSKKQLKQRPTGVKRPVIEALFRQNKKDQSNEEIEKSGRLSPMGQLEVMNTKNSENAENANKVMKTTKTTKTPKVTKAAKSPAKRPSSPKSPKYPKSPKSPKVTETPSVQSLFDGQKPIYYQQSLEEMQTMSNSPSFDNSTSDQTRYESLKNRNDEIHKKSTWTTEDYNELSNNMKEMDRISAAKLSDTNMANTI